jgi:hypothetical protein
MSKNFTRNHGRKGYVYILKNDALQPGLFKIGQSTRSGKVRASELNKEATTGLPAEYRCVYEKFTVDCGRAELAVHQQLAAYRRGKWGQEFFAVDLAIAKRVVTEVCKRQVAETRHATNESIAHADHDSGPNGEHASAQEWPFARKTLADIATGTSSSESKVWPNNAATLSRTSHESTSATNESAEAAPQLLLLRSKQKDDSDHSDWRKYLYFFLALLLIRAIILIAREA